MKKVKVVSVVLVCLMTLVFVSCEDSVTGADGGGGTGGGGQEVAFNGTWVYSGLWGEEVWIFNNGNFESVHNDIPGLRGTFSVSGNYFIMSRTHIHGVNGWWVESGDIIPLELRWYSRSELISTVTSHLRSAGESEGFISNAIWGIENAFSPMTAIFALSGSVLTLTTAGGTMTLTRRN